MGPCVLKCRNLDPSFTQMRQYGAIIIQTGGTSISSAMKCEQQYNLMSLQLVQSWTFSLAKKLDMVCHGCLSHLVPSILAKIYLFLCHACQDKVCLCQDITNLVWPAYAPLFSKGFFFITTVFLSPLANASSYISCMKPVMSSFIMITIHDYFSPLDSRTCS